METRSYTDESKDEVMTGIPSATTLNLETEFSRKARYLEIREISDNSVITALEILSHANKHKGKDRKQYGEKRSDLLGSNSNLVEIDLLRGQSRLTVDSSHNFSGYYILVSIADQRPQSQIHSFSIEETLPTFSLPLKQPDEAVLIDMQQIFDGVIERASYDSRIDYNQPMPAPALTLR